MVVKGNADQDSALVFENSAFNLSCIYCRYWSQLIFKLQNAENLTHLEVSTFEFPHHDFIEAMTPENGAVSAHKGDIWDFSYFTQS